MERQYAWEAALAGLMRKLTSLSVVVFAAIRRRSLAIRGLMIERTYSYIVFIHCIASVLFAQVDHVCQDMVDVEQCFTIVLGP